MRVAGGRTAPVNQRDNALSKVLVDNGETLHCDVQTKDNKVQATDRESGLPLWQVEVLDGNPAASKRARTLTVKFATPKQPVCPPNTAGMPFTPVIFEGLCVLPYVDRSSESGRIAWSFRASGMTADTLTHSDEGQGRRHRGRRLHAGPSQGDSAHARVIPPTVALWLRPRDEVAMVLGDGLADAAPAHRINPSDPESSSTRSSHESKTAHPKNKRSRHQTAAS